MTDIYTDTLDQLLDRATSETDLSVSVDWRGRQSLTWGPAVIEGRQVAIDLLNGSNHIVRTAEGTSSHGITEAILWHKNGDDFLHWPRVGERSDG